MKKIYLVAIMMLAATFANAQQRVFLNSYSGTNLEKYDNQECVVSISRYVFTGWNTLVLPFAVSESELDEAFGSDCRLERLVGAEQTAGGITLNFMDCKSEGMSAGVPYILYYSGESASKNLKKTALISKAQNDLSFVAGGVTVTMFGANLKQDAAGAYGVLVKDNAEAQFVNTDDVKGGFYATRCGVRLSNGNISQLYTRHLAAGEVTAISEIGRASEKVEVYNLSGQRIAANIRIADIKNLPAAIYVVKGRKVIVK